MRREHTLHPQLQERAQTVGDLLARDAATEPPSIDRDAAAEVGQSVAYDHRSPALDPKHDVVVRPARERLDAERQRVAGQELAGLSGSTFEQPPQVGAHEAIDLLGGEPELPHEI